MPSSNNNILELDTLWIKQSTTRVKYSTSSCRIRPINKRKTCRRGRRWPADPCLWKIDSLSVRSTSTQFTTDSRTSLLFTFSSPCSWRWRYSCKCRPTRPSSGVKSSPGTKSSCGTRMASLCQPWTISAPKSSYSRRKNSRASSRPHCKTTTICKVAAQSWKTIRSHKRQYSTQSILPRAAECSTTTKSSAMTGADNSTTSSTHYLIRR